MNGIDELVCLHPGAARTFQVRSAPIPSLGPRQVAVRVRACSINPIDVKRAQGYGWRLFTRLGAGGQTVVLGNDFAGEVTAVGDKVIDFKPGDRVFGLVPTGRHGGAHRSAVVADDDLVRRIPQDFDEEHAATLPYTFCTLWAALRALGLDAASSRERRVLIHGASGALGQLATQCLSAWGADVTAVCRARHADLCLGLGARHVVDRLARRLDELPSRFHVTLNFGAWEDDATLVQRLGPDAIGHATTVHPLLSLLDTRGWLAGAWHSATQWARLRRLAKRQGKQVRYAWIVFHPDTQAMDALIDLMRRGHASLAIATALPFSRADSAFEQAAQGGPQRVILRPGT